MSRIEELPDDFNENIDLNKLTEGHSVEQLEASNARRDPETQAEQNGKSFKDSMAEFSKVPLFMTSLDEAGDAGTPP
jgi:hypothetical protein